MTPAPEGSPATTVSISGCRSAAYRQHPQRGALIPSRARPRRARTGRSYLGPWVPSHEDDASKADPRPQLESRRRLFLVLRFVFPPGGGCLRRHPRLLEQRSIRVLSRENGRKPLQPLRFRRLSLPMRDRSDPAGTRPPRTVVGGETRDLRGIAAARTWDRPHVARGLVAPLPGRCGRLRSVVPAPLPALRLDHGGRDAGVVTQQPPHGPVPDPVRVGGTTVRRMQPPIADPPHDALDAHA